MSIFRAFLDILSIIMSLTVRRKVDLVKRPVVPPVSKPNRARVNLLDATEESAFKLGPRSRKELVGVHPEMVRLVKRAIQITNMDFTVFDGKRSAKEQNRHFKNGVSQLDGYKKKSYHQSGNAVDLVPVIDGKENHADWDNYYHVAQAVVQAANELGIASKIRWGAVWDRRLNKLPKTANALKKEVRAYTVRHPGKDFIDGPHWEWRG